MKRHRISWVKVRHPLVVFSLRFWHCCSYFTRSVSTAALYKDSPHVYLEMYAHMGQYVVYSCTSLFSLSLSPSLPPLTVRNTYIYIHMCLCLSVCLAGQLAVSLSFYLPVVRVHMCACVPECMHVCDVCDVIYLCTCTYAHAQIHLRL